MRATRFSLSPLSLSLILYICRIREIKRFGRNDTRSNVRKIINYTDLYEFYHEIVKLFFQNQCEWETELCRSDKYKQCPRGTQKVKMISVCNTVLNVTL